MDASDKILEIAATELAAAHAMPVPINWQQILAMLANMLGGCLTPPTPAHLREQIVRPLVQLQLHRQLLRAGYQASQISGIIKTVAAKVTAAPDEQLAAFIQAEQESR